MALTTVSEQRRVDPTNLYEETSKSRLNQNVSISVDSSIRDGALLKALGDKYTRMILLSVIDDPKSVIEISREQNIPISSVYRKIHWLENSHLIGVKGFVITNDGKKYHMYQSRIKTVHITLTTNAIGIEFTSNNGRTYNPSPEQEIPID